MLYAHLIKLHPPAIMYSSGLLIWGTGTLYAQLGSSAKVWPISAPPPIVTKCYKVSACNSFNNQIPSLLTPQNLIHALFTLAL